ncbi:MAG: hypothetical protein IT287_08660 [Bdellovibrionaceae bacterium]|nr:hypothetical protein [Pseudobdellovibrionaceae bacterium]
MKRHLQNNQGQMTVEAVLLLVIFVAVFTVVHKTISKGEWMSKIVSGPWSYMQGMISNGVWQAGNTNELHPNVFKRRASPEPL